MGNKCLLTLMILSAKQTFNKKSTQKKHICGCSYYQTYGLCLAKQNLSDLVEHRQLKNMFVHIDDVISKTNTTSW